MNCQQATRLISEGQDRPLAVAEKTGVRLHLMICVNCRRFNAQMGVLRQATGLLAEAAAPLPDELDEPGESASRHDDGSEGGSR